MPELPEVETIRADLDDFLPGRLINTVQIFSFKSALPSANFLIQNLTGRIVKKVDRRGKLLIFYLNNKIQSKQNYNYLLIHLKMTGQLIYIQDKTRIIGGHSLKDIVKESNKVVLSKDWEDSVGGALPNKYTRIQLNFIDGSKLFFNDLRKFGYFKLVTKEQLEKILDNYGIEPLTKQFNWKSFQTIFKGRRTKIKALLLNQKIIAGLGNIYVDESLWRAKIDPERPVNTLELKEIKILYQSIKNIISQAIRYRGTTFNNYVDSAGRRGNFSQLLKVYHHQGQACSRCAHIILRKKVAGRSSHYCPYCQK